MKEKIIKSIRTVFQKGFVHILAGSFMTKLVSMFGSIFLVRILSKETYGILGYLENIYGYVLVVAGMGMANAILRYVVLGKTPEEKYGYFRYSVKRAMLWNVILCGLVALVFQFYPHKEEYRPYAWMLNVMFLMLPLQNLTELVLCNERAMFANQRFAFFSLLLSLAVIISKITMGAVGGVEAVVFGQLAVYGVMAAVLLFSTRKKYHQGIQPQLLERQEQHAVNRYAIQYMITNGLWTVFMLNDTFLLGRFWDPTVVADYRTAYAIPGCVNIVSSAIGVFVAPYFVRNEQDLSWVQKHFKLTFALSAAVIGAVCLAIGLAARPVVWLLYGEQYLNIVPTMRVLLLAAFCNCGLRYTTANILAAMGQVKYNMAISAVGMGLQIAINLLIVPTYGAIGVAATSCIVYLFMAAVLFAVFAKRYFRKER